ncbi:hypothetical protein TSH7_09840 [Azospirillum sp. TSH7]|nr:hypothetical protein TSH20_18935 [Azospirillum sp. TSH20]PWC64834.1 hypothetical protein TSH7_09840 [Azospirillum sp. TSH7]
MPPRGWMVLGSWWRLGMFVGRSLDGTHEFEGEPVGPVAVRFTRTSRGWPAMRWYLWEFGGTVVLAPGKSASRARTP